MKLIKNAKIYTMEEENFENGFLLIDGAIIKAVGDMKDVPESLEECEVIDAAGLSLLPGFIDAHCHVGLWAEGGGTESSDGNERSDPVTPQIRAIDGIDPFDEAFVNARNAGVTCVVTGPGSANILGGQFAALKTKGNCVDKMIIKAPVAQKAALGENPKKTYSPRTRMPFTRMGTASLLRETLAKAKEYTEAMDKYLKNTEENSKPSFDFKMESLIPVMRREIPLKVHAHRADDICTAIRIGEEFDIRVTLEHCTEGHLIADVLAEKNLPVMLGPTMTPKSKPELKNKSYDTYLELEKRGIDFAIITDHNVIAIENLYLCASLAVKHGLKKETAMRAITINAAKNTGIDDRVGSIKAGKDADLILMSGEPMSMDARIEFVMINGERCDS